MNKDNNVNKLSILLVEDELSLHDIIKLNLELENFNVVSAYDGIQAIQLFKSNSFSCVILDIMMPHINGFEVCKTIRSLNKKCPIIFLSARDKIEDKINGLELGADDYLTKPFHFKELLLRIEKLIQRSQNISSQKTISTYTIGTSIIDFDSFKVKTELGTTINLTERQINMLALLIAKKNQVVSRSEILQKIWKYDIIPNTRTIDNVILLYRKIFEEPTGQFYFKSIRGVGYMYIEE